LRDGQRIGDVVEMNLRAGETGDVDAGAGGRGGAQPILIGDVGVRVMERDGLHHADVVVAFEGRERNGVRTFMQKRGINRKRLGIEQLPLEIHEADSCAVDLNGDAIVSDGEHGGVYRVSRKTQRIERIDAGDFISPQTPVALADGKRVLVPDYVRGIGVLDLDTKHVVWIPMEGKHAVNGIDGLYAFGSTLIATQNGTSPERVVRFALDASKTHVLSESIIERATPTLGDPTHGVTIGGYFYYIANSGWDNLDDHGVLKEGKTLSAPVIMRAKL